MKTEVIKVGNHKQDKVALKRAAAVIRSGGLVAFPTETVYGLAADATNDQAMSRLYEAKGRPREKPCSLLISNVRQMEPFGCEISPYLRHLVDRFWPGPLTIVCLSSSMQKIGFRMPQHDIALALIDACHKPLAVPSANLSGEEPPRTALDVLRGLDGKIEMLIDGGPSDVGIESTVLDASAFPYKVLRNGAIRKSQIIDVGMAIQHMHA